MRIAALLISIAAIVLTIRPLVRGTVHAQPRRSATFTEIAGLLPSNCDFCHEWDPQAKKAGFFTASYAGLMDGAFRNGGFHREIIPGDAANSPLVQYIEGRRQPRMPYGRTPLSADDIALIRQWIDEGAKPDATTALDHTLVMDGIDVSEKRNSFWLSCRAPKNEQNIALRVKVVDEATKNVVAYEWPGDEGGGDFNGRWSQWKVTVPTGSMKFPGTVSVELAVSQFMPSEYRFREGEDALNGVIFLLDQAKTNPGELLKQKDLRVVPQPLAPPYHTIRFSYILRAASDVSLTVKPQGGGPVLFQWSDRDLPPDRELLTSSWNLFSPPMPKAGWYCVRMKCTSRETGKFQPDMGILFSIKR